MMGNHIGPVGHDAVLAHLRRLLERGPVWCETLYDEFYSAAWYAGNYDAGHGWPTVEAWWAEIAERMESGPEVYWRLRPEAVRV